MSPLFRHDNPRWPWPVLLAALAGVAQAFALAWPWGVEATAFGAPGWGGQPQPLLQLAAMAVWVALLRRAPSVWAAVGLGWVFATGWLAGTFWWLFVSMHTYGGLAAPLAALAVLALAGALAVYYAAVAGLFRLFRLEGLWWSALVFAALWTLAELARGQWMTGFPWGAVGYTHVDSLGWAAPYVGVYGMGALAAGLAAALAATWQSNRTLALPVAVSGLAVALLAAGPWLQARLPAHTTPVGTLSLALLQGNINQSEKFDALTGMPKALAWYPAHLVNPLVSTPGAADARLPALSLVVAPETALPLLPQQAGPGLWGPLLASLAQGTHAALLGLPLGNAEQGYANAAWAITPQAAAQAAISLAQGRSMGQLDQAASPHARANTDGIYRYEKHHLVPFGEFIPRFFRWFVDLMHIPLGDFNRGALAQPTFDWAGQRVAPNICYEDLFGEELAQGFADAATAPTVMVNLSNMAWFGNTVAMNQHLQSSRLRALELARPMVRATNTGATVAIDHRGRVKHALPRLTQGVLLASVEGQQGLTPYARWASRGGLWPAWAMALAVVLAGAAMARAQRSGRP